MKVIDNISTRLKDELMQSIQKGSKVTIAASCFSMYAYKELKKQLDTIDELRFLFTSPTFVKESARKERREFYIPRLDRESGLYGTEFEIKLRNEMTQKAIAKECAEWIKKKVKFRSNISGDGMIGFVKEESVNTAFKVGNYYHTDWVTEDAFSLVIDGLNMDTVYENLVRQIAGDVLAQENAESLKETVERQAAREKLSKEIERLRAKIRREKQFNRQVELNGQLKELKRELEDMT